LRKLSELIPEIKSTDYTNIWRRGTQLKLSLPDTISASDEPVVIAVDSTGIKVTNRGEWMRENLQRTYLAMNTSYRPLLSRMRLICMG